MLMTQEAIEAEAPIHALIREKMSVFSLPSELDLMTAREDWEDVEEDYADVVTPELIAKFGGEESGGEGFLATLNGKIGQWVEMEYASTHRDDSLTLDEAYNGEVPPSPTELIARAAWAAILLQQSYPEASFRVSEGSHAWGGRVSFGAFLPEGIPNREEIIDTFYKTELPKLDISIVKQLYGDAYDKVNDYFDSISPPSSGLKM